mgnify:CR=1 FL=1
MSGLFNDDTLSLYLKLKEAMKQYVRDAMPGGVLNREIKPQDTLDAAALSLSPVPLVGDAAGLLADGYRYATDPSSRTPLNYGLSALGALPFVPSMAGQIAWHGSPHKFPPVRELLMPDGTKLIQDLTQSTHLPEGAKVIAEHPFGKFDLSKIGTGEGAQAYGYGLYLAESPDVAKSYQTALAADRGFSFDGKSGLTRAEVQDMVNAKYGSGYLDGVLRPSGVADSFIDDMVTGLNRVDGSYPRQYKPGSERAKVYDELRGKISHTDPGSLYKVDIPDEDVARFLDWDKPLSEQAKEVQAALAKTKNKQLRAMVDYANVPHSEAIGGEAKTMGEAFRLLNLNLHGKSSADSVKASALLAKQGIPGIRYLDGGSRGAGTGTSNFVVFDPEMIRILERNGEATGAKPWQPGEWEGLFKK